MATTVLPVRFYQVRSPEETIDYISEKFQVKPENISTDQESQPTTFKQGTIVCIRNF